MSRSQFFFFFFFKCLNATIPLASTLANEYPPSNETSKKNGTVRGDCIACDALLYFTSFDSLSYCFGFNTPPNPRPFKNKI